MSTPKGETTPVFQQTRDIELWVIRDIDGQLPVLIKPGMTPRDGREAWLVTMGCGFSAAQITWFQSHIDALTRSKYGGWWLVRPERAKLCMFKAKGITPEYYIQWGELTKGKAKGVTINGSDPHPGDELDQIGTAMDAFIRYAANKSGIKNLPYTRYIWLQLCRSAVNWMVVDGKPLDMGFCKLHAFPFRRNWLAVMAAKYPYYGEIAKMPVEERERRLAGTTFQWMLEQPEMASMADPAQFDWTLDIELDERWHEFTTKAEKEQLTYLGPQEYYQRWLKMVRRSYKQITSTFHDYFQTSAQPVGDVDQGLPLHSRFLRWLLQKGLVRPAPTTVPPVAHIAGESVADTPPKKTPPAIKTFEGMPDLPDEDITQRLLDLRDARRVAG